MIFCTNFEEAVDVYDRYRDSMFGVITDMAFPKEGEHPKALPNHLQPTWDPALSLSDPI